MAATTYPQVFTWNCPDCRGQGEVTIVFPCSPRELDHAVMAEHRKIEQHRHCVCPAHSLKVKPKPLAL